MAGKGMDADAIIVRGRVGQPGRRPRRRPVAERKSRSSTRERRKPRRSGVLVVRRTVLVDSPEQRRMGVRTPFEQPGTAGRAAPRSTDSTARIHQGVRWARAYVEFAAGEKRSVAPATAGITLPPTSAGPNRAICGAEQPRQLGAALPRRLGWHPRSSNRSSESALGARHGLVTFITGTGSTSWSSTSAVWSTRVRGAMCRHDADAARLQPRAGRRLRS